MNIIFNSNHFNTIIYTKLCCVPSFMQNKPSLNDIMRESAQKRIKKLKMHLCTIARNFKHMTIVLHSNHLNIIIYTKYYCVASFMANKPSLNYFTRECLKRFKNCKNAIKYVISSIYDYFLILTISIQ